MLRFAVLFLVLTIIVYVVMWGIADPIIRQPRYFLHRLAFAILMAICFTLWMAFAGLRW